MKEWLFAMTKYFLFPYLQKVEGVPTQAPQEHQPVDPSPACCNGNQFHFRRQSSNLVLSEGRSHEIQ